MKSDLRILSEETDASQHATPDKVPWDVQVRSAFGGEWPADQQIGNPEF
jgi:hypothetical protein